MARSPPPPSDHLAPPSGSSSTMSLAILPSSPMSYSEPSLSAMASAVPSLAKRPRLSLNTTNAAPTFGKKSTSLRLETLSATSPTAVNTFSNGYDSEKSLKISTSKSTRPSLAIATHMSCARPAPRSAPSLPILPETTDTSDATASSAVSVSSVSSSEFSSTEPAYKMAYNVNSILKNGPYPRTHTRQRVAFAQPRTMFPGKKTVTFKAALTEDIQNSKYTQRHSDIEASSLTILLPQHEGEAMRFAAAAAAVVSTVDGAPTQARSNSVIALCPPTGNKRESPDEYDGDTCPQTPVAGRRKRTRQWRWTIGSAAHEEENIMFDEDEDEE